MKSFFGVLSAFVILSTSIQTMACEDGQAMAEEAAQKLAQRKVSRKCSVIDSELSSGKTERWVVSLKCPEQAERTVDVRLKEHEDAICSVQSASLRPMSGSGCGLSDYWGGDEGNSWKIFDQKTISVHKLTRKQISDLPGVTKKQLLATASDGLEEKPKDVYKAVESLIEGSEGGEVYVYYVAFNGNYFDAVKYYGGGNPVGLVFEIGKSKPLAEIGDDSIYCKD